MPSEWQPYEHDSILSQQRNNDNWIGVETVCRVQLWLRYTLHTHNAHSNYRRTTEKKKPQPILWHSRIQAIARPHMCATARRFLGSSKDLWQRSTCVNVTGTHTDGRSVNTQIHITHPWGDQVVGVLPCAGSGSLAHDIFLRSHYEIVCRE